MKDIERFPGVISNIKILIVDDEENIKQTVGSILSEWGNICEFASDGVQGFQSVMESHFDLILIDIQMPNMNGIECVQAIRLVDPKVPIIIMTGYEIQEEIQKGLEQGANAFIRKPFEMEELSEMAVKLVTTP